MFVLSLQTQKESYFNKKKRVNFPAWNDYVQFFFFTFNVTLFLSIGKFYCVNLNLNPYFTLHKNTSKYYISVSKYENEIHKPHRRE